MSFSARALPSSASSLPLKAVASDFAVDSSGFSTSRFVRWYSKKHGKVKGNGEWVKVHLMCGTNTKTVTGVEGLGDAPIQERRSLLILGGPLYAEPHVRRGNQCRVAFLVGEGNVLANVIARRYVFAHRQFDRRLFRCKAHSPLT